MHVLINAASANMGGAVTYLQNVLRWLPRVAPKDTFAVFVPQETVEKLIGIEEASNVDIRAYPYQNTGGKERFYFDQVLLPKLVRSSRADVLYSTTGFGTFVSPCPQVLLVRNVAYFDRNFQKIYLELGRSLRTNTVRRWLSFVSINRADAVIFPTRSTMEAVEEYQRLSTKRTAVFPYGFDKDVFGGDVGNAPIVPDVKRWRSKGQSILLYVSAFAVHKNFETLIEALRHLVSAGTALKLLITTSREKTADKTEYDRLFERVRMLELTDHVVEVGHLPYGDLGTLYREADLFVFPSFAESFGHPMVEAMAMGLPIVAADTPVNREICGGAGMYFRPFDSRSCAELIGSLLRDPSMRRQMAESSLQRSFEYSWETHTRSLLELFREYAHGRRIN